MLGGNLAAVASLWARDHSDISIQHQLLLNPVTAYYPDNESFSTYSRAFWMEHCPTGAGGYPLSTEDMAWYWHRYLRSDVDAEHPYAVPLQARELADSPPATVVTSELDPLRDEGQAYARRLTDAGVPVKHIEYEGVFHSFLALWHELDRANTALAEVSNRITTALNGG